MRQTSKASTVEADQACSHRHAGVSWHIKHNEDAHASYCLSYGSKETPHGLDKLLRTPDWCYCPSQIFGLLLILNVWQDHIPVPTLKLCVAT